MRLTIASVLAVVCGLVAAPASALSVPEQDPAEIIPRVAERDIIHETEHYCLTLALYFEGGSTGESEIGLRHIARVIVERANANRQIWGGSTICGVVFYERMGVCQFSFACLPRARRTPRRNSMWHFSAEIARDALEGENEGPPELIRYYLNAEYTPLKNICRFQKEFVPVVKAGRHEFFREPTSLERLELMRSEPEACQRYQAMLDEQKRQAELKKLAKKKGKNKKKPTAVAKAKTPKSKDAKVDKSKAVKLEKGKGAKSSKSSSAAPAKNTKLAEQ